MKIISNNASLEQELIASIQGFFTKFSVGNALTQKLLSSISI